MVQNKPPTVITPYLNPLYWDGEASTMPTNAEPLPAVHAPTEIRAAAALTIESALERQGLRHKRLREGKVFDCGAAAVVVAFHQESLTIKDEQLNMDWFIDEPVPSKPAIPEPILSKLHECPRDIQIMTNMVDYRSHIRLGVLHPGHDQQRALYSVPAEDIGAGHLRGSRVQRIPIVEPTPIVIDKVTHFSWGNTGERLHRVTALEVYKDSGFNALVPILRKLGNLPLKVGTFGPALSHAY